MVEEGFFCIVKKVNIERRFCGFNYKNEKVNLFGIVSGYHVLNKIVYNTTFREILLSSSGK